MVCNKWSVKINAEKCGILHAYEEEGGEEN